MFRIVRKTQHQNPEFGPNLYEIPKKNLHKSTVGFNRGKTQKCTILIFFGGGEVSFILFWPALSLLLSASTAAATYIFTAPTCTTTKVPQTWCIKCWVSAFHTQIKWNFITLRISLDGLGGWKEAQRHGGEDTVTSLRNTVIHIP